MAVTQWSINHRPYTQDVGLRIWCDILACRDILLCHPYILTILVENFIISSTPSSNQCNTVQVTTSVEIKQN